MYLPQMSRITREFSLSYTREIWKIVPNLPTSTGLEEMFALGLLELYVRIIKPEVFRVYSYRDPQTGNISA